MAKLASRYRVAVVDEQRVPYKLNFDLEKLSTPVLDGYIAKYEEVSSKVFIAKDREPARVGVILPSEFHLEESSLRCVRVDWAQSHVRSRVSLDMLPENERFYRLAVDVLLKTGEGHYILAKRLEKVSEYKGHWDVSAAGWVDLSQALETGSLEDQILRELHEEVGLTKYEVFNVTQLGLCLNPMPEYSMAEVCYVAETDLGTNTVLKLSKSAKDSWEGKHKAFSRFELLQILKFELFKPAGAATVMLALGIPFTEEI